MTRLREDELVEQLRSLVEGTRHAAIRLGIGDDAAVWQPSRSHRSVVTTDALVEGVHFTRETMSFEDVGWRAAVANLSDLAAMGARPVLATIALGVPASAEAKELLDLYRGIAACAKMERLAIVGGDLTQAPVLTIAMTAIGEVRRVEEGRWFAASANVRAMMDCSDGLSTDLLRLCKASGVGARIDEVPVAEAARAAAQALGEEPRAYALAGGEEFELIVAIERRAFSHLAERFRARFGRPLQRIGTLRQQPGVVLVENGEEKPIASTGWESLSGV